MPALALPWANGERLEYALYFRGLWVGNFALSAERTPEGWRFRGAPLGLSLARLAGFDLALFGESDPELRFYYFKKALRAPGVGQLVLEGWRDGEGFIALRRENGRLAARYRYPDPEVKNDLSLLYHLRVRPEGGPVTLLGLYGPVRGRLKALGPTAVRVPAGRFSALRFLLDHPGAYFEAFLAGKTRLPVKLVLGFGQQRIEAQLLHQP